MWQVWETGKALKKTQRGKSKHNLKVDIQVDLQQQSRMAWIEVI